MFCYQCEQTAKGVGCTSFGVCGKDPETAALQDLLVHGAKAISSFAHRASKLGARDAEVDKFVTQALFTTLTNVSFDPKDIAGWVYRAAAVRDQAKKLYDDAHAAAGKEPCGCDVLKEAAAWTPAADYDELIKQGEAATIEQYIEKLGPDVAGLQQLLTYGVKGTAAYADHARLLGHEDDSVYAFFHEALSAIADGEADVNTLVGLNLKCGEVNLKAMGLLDAANTGAYGHPEPTPVRVTAVRGRAILVSGHDLRDLKQLLEQTEGKGINVYTHGEMLPAHGYPELKKHKHLVGNYGGAWQNQRTEFEAFPGAILMTTNCLQKPKDSYLPRLFTTGVVRWPDANHIADADVKDFAPVIAAALADDGFHADEPEHSILVGFGHNAVMNVAGAVIDAVKAGSVRHFFLIGGCDGAKPGRSYYTELAEKVPEDCVILTLACGKYRFNKLDFGDIGGIPRLLDIGQCNDAYSAIQIAVALANAFETDVNSLPLSMVLSWYEQKACCILLTLLHLGIQNIRLGPSLPAFVGPNVLNVLVDTFGLAPVSTPDEDLAAILG